MSMGRIICAGLGPGDPDLISVRSDRVIRAARHIAYFRKAGRSGQARAIVEGMLRPDVVELPMDYPVTTEIPAGAPVASVPWRSLKTNRPSGTPVLQRWPNSARVASCPLPSVMRPGTNT